MRGFSNFTNQIQSFRKMTLEFKKKYLKKKLYFPLLNPLTSILVLAQSFLVFKIKFWICNYIISKILSEHSPFSLKIKFQCETGNFFEYEISSDKKGVWVLDFLTKGTERFFLNRMICNKGYFWQVLREYRPNQNPNWK